MASFFTSLLRDYRRPWMGAGSSLTEAGFASIDAAFPGGAGPKFPGKEQMLTFIEDLKAKKAEESQSKAKLVPRKDRSRSRSRSRRR
eukprot:symbB.v1.2.031957.t1/scaffold3732.1/size51291/4